MKSKLTLTIGLLTSVLCLPVFAQGTAFTYQGRLNDGATPANGTYDLRFVVYSVSSGGSVLAGPVTNAAVTVSDGLFTATLDFGAGAFTGPDRWLEIGVRTNGAGVFTTLAPRQPLTATPYALHAKGVNAAGITGTLPASSLFGAYTSPLTFNNGANSFNGSFYGQFLGTSFTGGFFAGDGSGLINLNASQITEGNFPAATLGNAWRIIGNNGTSETNFIGTTDNQALNFRVNNLRGFRIEPDPRPDNNSANIIGGNRSNRIEFPGSGGSFIGGGGFDGGPNIIRSNSSGVFIGAGSVNEVGPNANDVVIAGGFANVARSFATVMGGGGYNLIQTNSVYSTISGGYLNSIQSNSSYSIIAGGAQNMLQSESATIGGGVGNINLGYAATIAGGFFNAVSNNGAFVGGGGNNVAGGFNSVVAGGNNNIGTAVDSVIGGGRQNTNRGFASTIGGGYWNQITNSYATVPGGALNLAGGQQSFAAGTFAKAIHTGAFVWNDSTGLDFFSVTNDEFAVRASGGVRFVTAGGGITFNGQPVLTASATNAITLSNPANTIVGTFTGNGTGLTNLNAWRLAGNAGTTAGANFVGTTDNQPLEIKVNNIRALRIEPNTNGAPNVIGGAPINFVAPSIYGATIGGGGAINSGGFVRSNSVFASFATVSGGWENRIAPDAVASTIAGGYSHDIGTNAFYALIGGGANNNIFANSYYGTISGGGLNAIGAGSVGSTIAGGEANGIGDNSLYAFIAGGSSNDIGTNSSGAVIGGGFNNNILSSAAAAVIPGGSQNSVAGAYAFAAGRQAKANHTGSFVWADSTAADFASSAQNQFLIRSGGGVGINTNNPNGAALAVNGNIATTGSLLFSDPTKSITFPEVPGASTAMINMFATGAGNSTRMVIAHSPVFQNYGLRYIDLGDQFEFIGAVGSILNIGLASGNIGIGTNSPNSKLHVVGGALFTSGTGGANQSVSWSPGTASWSFTSDRNAKDRVQAVNPEAVLAKVTRIPIHEWSYIGHEQRHIGPMAQDFHAQFPLNPNDKALNDADLHGVALAAIQGLNQKVDALKTELQQHQTENAVLKQELESLKQAVTRLAQTLD